MTYDPEKHHRRSIRLKGYDYSQPGAYFVTIVTHNRKCLFGDVVNGEMRLNQYGEIVQHAWFDLPRHYPHVQLGAFCVMPNHIHGIIIIIGDNDNDNAHVWTHTRVGAVGAGLRPAPTRAARVDDGAARVDDGAARVDDGAARMDDGAARVDDGMARMDDGAARVDDGMARVDDGMARVDDGAAPIDSAPTITRHSLSEIVRALKSFSARRINHIRQTSGVPVWQRNYYDRIIRSVTEYNQVCHYIETNPANWMNDSNNLQRRNIF
jgi:REP element-mobilizing transposase RayT